jgi:hypothetical protein
LGVAAQKVNQNLPNSGLGLDFLRAPFFVFDALNPDVNFRYVQNKNLCNEIDAEVLGIILVR